MHSTIEIRTFVSKIHSDPEQKRAADVIGNILPELTDRIRRDIYARRNVRTESESNDTSGPVTVCIRPAEDKEQGLDLPDVWILITVPRREILELRQSDLHSELVQSVCESFRGYFFTMRIDLDLSDVSSQEITTSPLLN